MVLELLVLGGRVAHQSTAGLLQVSSRVEEVLVHQEVFLLPSEIGNYSVYVFVEQLADLDGSLVDCSHRSQKRSFEVKSFAGIGHEDAVDAEGLVDHEGRRRRIPRAVSAGFEGVADAAARERTCIRLLL